MVTAPTVVDPRQWDYEYEDQEEMIFKQNALNEYRYNFSVQLAAMCDELNIEFQYVEETRIDISNMSGQVAADRQAVTQMKASVDQSKNHIDQQKQAIDSTAGQVSDHAQEVADNRQLVADDKQAAADSAHAAGESAGQAEQSKQAAQDLYQDLEAVNTAKTQSQQAAQTAGEQAGLAESSAATATEQAGIATQAAQDTNVDIDEKLADYVPRTGADLGGADLKARLTHNSNYFYLGSFNSATYGEGQLKIWWNHNAGQLDMGGAELRNVSVRNADVTGRKPVTNMDLVGPSGTDVAGSVFALQADGRVPTIRDNVNLSRASGFYYALGAANAPDGNGHFFWSSYTSDYNKYLFIRQNTANRAWIGGNHNGAWSTPAEIWTTENLNLSAITSDLYLDKARPWLTLKSPTTGDSGVEQAAGITLGESVGASLHITYTGDGRGHIGMGAVDANTALPANEAMGLYYQNQNVTFFGDIELPQSVTLKGVVDGLRINNNANGGVEIGNRNGSYTHYTSDNGKHYFYGEAHAQSGFYGNGSGLTSVNASQLNGQSRSVNDDANTIAGRDSAGDIRARLFRSTYTSTNSNVAVIYTAKEADGTDFMRPSTPAQVRAALDLDDLGAITGSNSRGRYYLYPDGRLVMQCGVKTFTQDPSAYRYLLCKVTLPYTPLGSAEHYVTATPSSDASDYSSGASPLDVAPPLAKPGRQSSGTVVEVRVANISKSNHSSGATAKASILVESRWK